MKHQRGVALLLVLWVLARLSVMLSGLAGWVQLQSRQSAWNRQHAQAQLAAEAGLNIALQGLTDPQQRQRWVADGREITLEFDGAQLRIKVFSERGKLDMNGASSSQAQALAHGLQAQRSKDAESMQVIEQARQLPGMTQPLYTRMLAHITLWSGLDRPDPAFASDTLRRALNLGSPSAIGVDAGEVLVIDCRAQRPGGYHARLQTTVLLSPSEGSAQPYKVLRWQE